MNAGVAVLSLLPVFYIALYKRSRIDLLIVLAEVAALYLLPILLIGAPNYPNTQYRAALLTIAVGAIVGFVTQRLVASVREQRAKAESRGDMLEQISETVHELFASPNPREDVCRAVARISKASSAMLCEPTGELGRFRASAHYGLLSPTAQPVMDGRSRLGEAMSSGRRILVDSGCEAEFADREQWQAAGSPGSILYQPLINRGAGVGLLVVTWSGNVDLDNPRATVAALLAHEAAAVIERADQVATLSDEAHTDSLTGLPNRRAWSRRLLDLSLSGRPLTICVLDLDRFKAYNDAHGHPAGDRLLRETTAAWRDELRGEDFLARIGGEEFGLLLDTASTGDALEVVARLRQRVARRQTCSAGVAVRIYGESAESVVTRADQALYTAKESGRDRVVVDSVEGQATGGAGWSGPPAGRASREPGGIPGNP